MRKRVDEEEVRYMRNRLCRELAFLHASYTPGMLVLCHELACACRQFSYAPLTCLLHASYTPLTRLLHY